MLFSSQYQETFYYSPGHRIGYILQGRGQNNKDTKSTTMLIWIIWYNLKHVEPFETIGDFLELFNTFWDHLGSLMDIWDHLEPFRAICDISYYLGPSWKILNNLILIKTIWDHLRQFDTI